MSSHRRPRPKISPWARIRAYLRYWHSPLKLRRSFHRLKSPHMNAFSAFFALLRLFISFPSMSFKVPSPVSPHDLIDDEKNGSGIINSRFEGLRNLQAIPLWRMRDTPLRSVYRIYELFLANRYGLMGYETEYFFFHSDWRSRDIPDPNDSDPVRYAVLACVVEELHKSLNWKLSLGIRRNGEQIIRERDEDPWPEFVPEELPEWTTNVAAIDKEVLRQSVPPHKLNLEGQLVLEEDGQNRIFARRNIITNTGRFYTI